MHPDILADLAASGLIPKDINAREAGPPELAAVKISSSNVRGYKIPYYTLESTPLPFYRLRLFDHHPKYKQPQNSENYIYYPPELLNVLGKLMVTSKPPYYMLLTEGEKKAAAAVKAGFPAIAFTGVDSWRTKTFTVPDGSSMDTSIFGKTKQVRIKLPSTDIDFIENLTLAVGMKELIDLLVRRSLHAIIVYDTDANIDEESGIKPQVQRAAATLGYELRFRSVPFDHIRQLVLPTKGSKLEKIGLDDFLMESGPEKLQKLITEIIARPIAFPRHPSPKTYVNQRLNRRLTRKEAQNVSLSILTELDSRGQRLTSKGTNTPYYFDKITKRLMPALLLHQRDDPMHETPFGHFLYREFNLSAADTRVLHWLASQFTGEMPIQEVDPRRVLTVAGGVDSDEIAVQINDGQYALVTADKIEILDNGTNGLLFEFDQVEGMAEKDIKKELTRQMKRPVEPWWYEVLGTVNLSESNLYEESSAEQRTERSKVLGALLCYISPWLNRWRGTQLPIELMIGEAGSGKSSLYTLRQSIITGRPLLRNAPSDLRDWYSSVISTGGIHVIDNVQFINKDLRQRLSDELAQPLDALVMTPTGYQTMGSLSLGNVVLDPWGRHSHIIAIHLHGVKPVYRVTLSDSSSTECCLDHLWAIHTSDDLNAKVRNITKRILPLKELMKEPLRYKGKTKRLRWYIPALPNTQIDLTRDDLNYKALNTLSPYVLGAFLGDGNLSSRQLFLAGIQQDIIDRVSSELPKGCDFGSSQRGLYYVRGSWRQLHNTFESLGLKGTLSRTKFVPLEYLFTTAKNRLDLLRGLMDTDGTVNASSTGTAVFSSMSAKLASAVQFLCQSLGGRSNLSRRADGAYQVSVSLRNDISPFWCTKKSVLYNKFSIKPKRGYRAITNIEYIGKKEVQCISLDTPEGLYLTNDFIITHNCRITTEPYPHIEMRKLYTTSTQVQIPVRSTFAMTAIQQPFFNADIIQRAAIFELSAITEGIDGSWVDHQIERFGGRTRWFVHQLVVLHRFLKAVVKDGAWDHEYRASHRLVNYEQCLLVMGDVLGLDAEWVSEILSTAAQSNLTEADWTMEGLKVFAAEIRQERKKASKIQFTSSDITQWAMDNEEYSGNDMLTNTRRIGRYIQSHKSTVKRITGIEIGPLYGNRRQYTLGASR